MKIFRCSVSVVGWVTAVLLSIIYGNFIFVYLKAYSWIRTAQNSCFYLKAFPLLGILFVVLAIGFCVLLTFVCRKKRWDPKGYWRTVVVALLTLPLIALRIDAPPVENDYTRADIAPPSKAVEKSYDVLMTYRKGKGPFCNFDAPHIHEAMTNALPYAEEVEKAWQSISADRRNIEKLDLFDQIVDLTPGISLDFNTPILAFMPLRIIAQVYCAYAELKTEEGQTEEGVRHLVKIHSVCRKALPYSAAGIVSKMIWIQIAQCNIDTAYRIATKPNCTPEILKILKAGFSPLTQEDVSLRRPLIAEYLVIKHEIDLIGPHRGFPQKTAARIMSPFCFNRNQTIRDLKNQYDIFIVGASKCPPDLPCATNVVSTKRLRVKNPIGQMLVSCAMPCFSKAIDMSFKVKVLSDLLAIMLSKRLGEELHLPDFYTGREYIIDKTTGNVMSAGPDGIPGTKDDIILGK